MTLTKEWLEQTIAELEEERDAIPGAVNEDAAMALAAMKLDLASLETEPVAFINGAREPVMYGEHIGIPIGTHLYTAPPAPVSAPDFGALTKCIVQRLVDYGTADDEAIASAEEFVYNTCRAAMLQGAAGNSPAIPDGYALVPVELTGAMTNAMTDAILDDLHNVDVWRSVLAAAPQQENAS